MKGRRSMDRFAGIPETIMIDYVAHQLHLRQNEALKEYGVTARQAKMIMLIGRLEDKVGEGRINQKMIEKMTGLKGSTVTVALKYLDQSGFIEKGPSSDDRRANVIRLSARGRQVIPVMNESAVTLSRELTSNLEAEERKVFRTAIEKMAEQFGTLITVDELKRQKVAAKEGINKKML